MLRIPVTSQLQNPSACKIALLKPIAIASPRCQFALRSPASHCEDPPDLPSCLQQPSWASRRRRGSDRLCLSSQDALKSSIFHCRGVLLAASTEKSMIFAVARSIATGSRIKFEVRVQTLSRQGYPTWHFETPARRTACPGTRRRAPR